MLGVKGGDDELALGEEFDSGFDIVSSEYLYTESGNRESFRSAAEVLYTSGLCKTDQSEKFRLRISSTSLPLRFCSGPGGRSPSEL